MEIKGTYHCQTTQHTNTLNSWDIRSVSVELPEVQDKPYWHKIAASVIGFGMAVIILLQAASDRKIGRQHFSARKTAESA